MTASNPFAYYGSKVPAESFYGREREIAWIHGRILQGAEAGNVSVVGPPRIGKTSLVRHALLNHRPQLLARRLVPVELNVGTCSQARGFFHALVERSYKELEMLGWLTPPIARKRLEVRTLLTSSETEFNIALESYFQKVRESDRSLIFVLDEFDWARELFKGQPAQFQELRELGSADRMKVTLVTTSRRPLEVIEERATGISNFALTMGRALSLKPFGDAELNAFYDRLEHTGLHLDAPLRNRIVAHTGRHPFLLDMLGFELAQHIQGGQAVDLERACEETSASYVKLYEEILALLQEWEALPKLLQILFGPVFDLKREDATQLREYGLIQEAGSNYRAFSQHFEEFLGVEAREVDFWPLWRNAEQGLRYLVGSYLRERYGEDWLPRLLKARPKLNETFKRCQGQQTQELRNFGERASANLLDYTFPKDLFDVMRTEWTWFLPILKDTPEAWQPRFVLLNQIRNAWAHNRDATSYELERKEAITTCERLLAMIRAWEKAVS